MLRVTTSWDDGDILDARVAELLDRYHLKGTFYIPRDYWGERISDSMIQKLGTRHEIGAHTLTHVDLKTITLDEAHDEIAGSKRWLEGLSIESSMFCYPRGRYTQAVRDIVATSGFKGARTTKMFSTAAVSDPFQIETTIQVYPFPFRPGAGLRASIEPLRDRVYGFRAIDSSFSSLRSWEAATCSAFDAALHKGGTFHIWGHSWEIEKYNMWRPLEDVFRYVANRAECTYVTNGELVV